MRSLHVGLVVSLLLAPLRLFAEPPQLALPAAAEDSSAPCPTNVTSVVVVPSKRCELPTRVSSERSPLVATELVPDFLQPEDLAPFVQAAICAAVGGRCY